MILLLGGMALAGRVFDVQASGEHVAIARTGMVEVRRLSDGGLVHALPIGETELMALAVGGEWVVGSTRTRMLVWRAGRFVAAWPWPDEHRRGMRVDPEGFVLAWGHRTLGAFNASTGEALPMDHPTIGGVHDATMDGWIADNVGVLSPDGATLPLGDDCHFGPGLVACGGDAAMVHALPDAQPLYTLPGTKVIAVGPAGVLVHDAPGNRTVWVGPDGLLQHEAPGKWDGAVGARSVALVRGRELCLPASGMHCLPLDATAVGETVPAKGPAILFASEVSSMALGAADGQLRWSTAVGQPVEFGLAPLPPDQLPGLRVRKNGWAPASTPAFKLGSSRGKLELRDGERLLWSGEGRALGIAQGLAFAQTASGDLLALGAADGTLRWTLPLGSGRWSLGKGGEGMVLLWQGTEVLLVDAARGSEVRRFQRESASHALFGPLNGWLALEKSGATEVTDARTGAAMFTLPRHGTIHGVLPDGGIVRQLHGPDETTRIEVRDETELRWRILLGRPNNERAQVWVLNDLVVVQRGRLVMALEGKDASLRWSASASVPFHRVLLLE